ncbi:MAG TPA: DUF2062 domain-containing protein, partial [Gammaproteobacteria bacterium]|nr:DUF2062 domain-containing protein [Gammaproteobacteria bacterium]
VRFKRLLLNLTRLRRGQLLRPLRHRLRNKGLWSFDHHSVAKGAAIGVFFALLFPVAHILFAIVTSIALRANVVVAALATFVSNPLTMPIVYYSAYRIGALMIRPEAPDTPVAALESAQEAAQAALEVHQWLPALRDWTASVGAPTAIGIVTLAFAGAVTVYALVFAISAVWARISK